MGAGDITGGNYVQLPGPSRAQRIAAGLGSLAKGYMEQKNLQEQNKLKEMQANQQMLAMVLPSLIKQGRVAPTNNNFSFGGVDFNTIDNPATNSLDYYKLLIEKNRAVTTDPRYQAIVNTDPGYGPLSEAQIRNATAAAAKIRAEQARAISGNSGIANAPGIYPASPKDDPDTIITMDKVRAVAKANDITEEEAWDAIVESAKDKHYVASPDVLMWSKTIGSDKNKKNSWLNRVINK